VYGFEYDLEYVMDLVYAKECVMVYDSLCETVYEKACEKAMECEKAYVMPCG
jgi:hypothetical protein